ncbi:hypothetical protein [Tritonibacter mobilis]|uniref:hypothetical protein n=1 Tax=Tritonibacter mobilis TaxID=379347 RepID=UPI001CD96524|nr:hypothetical protein [Tritonibacter mobilis]MCA2009116.1 hypothetical protein [Tritonibacter mobilis]
MRLGCTDVQGAGGVQEAAAEALQGHLKLRDTSRVSKVPHAESEALRSLFRRAEGGSAGKGGALDRGRGLVAGAGELVRFGACPRQRRHVNFGLDAAELRKCPGRVLVEVPDRLLDSLDCGRELPRSGLGRACVDLQTQFVRFCHFSITCLF